MIHKQSGDQGSAIRQFAETLRLNPGNVEARLEVCAVMYSERGLDAAIAVLEGIPTGSSASAEYFRLLGQLYEQSEEYEAALGAYRHALGIDPLDAVTHQLLAAAYVRFGDERRASEHEEYATRLGSGP